MYHSAACWKTAAVVDRELAKIKTKTAQLAALKENIQMRVVGLGWHDLKTAWSKDGKEFSAAKLTVHLKTIIAAGKSRDIPSKPPRPLPERKELPTLGTMARDAAALELLQLGKGDAFEAKAHAVRAEREEAGVGDSCAERQQIPSPAVDVSLVGRRLEICCDYQLADGSEWEPRWCAGEVIAVSDGTNILKIGAVTAKYKKGEAVMMRWDARRDRNEVATESAARLLKSKWNPKGVQEAGGWRFDL